MISLCVPFISTSFSSILFINHNNSITFLFSLFLSNNWSIAVQFNQSVVSSSCYHCNGNRSKENRAKHKNWLESIYDYFLPFPDNMLTIYERKHHLSWLIDEKDSVNFDTLLTTKWIAVYCFQSQGQSWQKTFLTKPENWNVLMFFSWLD